jgi:tetratricopeptide (TPR) repeat protein
MILRFIRLVLALSILAALLRIISQNQATVTLTLLESWKLENYSLGTLVIVVFCAGVVCSSIAGVLRGAPETYASWKLRRELKKSHEFYKKISEAREASATRQWEKARLLWSDLTRLDPTDYIAAIEQSRAVEALGDYRQALKDLTAIKSVYPDNIEILLRCAALHERLDNKSGALDNLSHILSLETTPYVAQEATRLCLANGNHADAQEYCAMIESAPYSAEGEALGAKVGLLQLKSISLNAPVDEQITIGRRLIKRFPLVSETYGYVSQLLLEGGKPSEGVKLLGTGIKQTRDESLLRGLAITARRSGNYKDAFAVIHQLTKESLGLGLIAQVHLVSARMAIETQLFDQAAQTLQSARSLLEQNDAEELHSHREEFAFLQGLLQLEQGRVDGARAALRSLLTDTTLLPSSSTAAA